MPKACKKGKVTGSKKRGVAKSRTKGTPQYKSSYYA